MKKKFAALAAKPEPESNAIEQGATADAATLENLLKNAAKAPPEMREDLWSQAAMKALSDGDADGARQIVNGHFSEAGQREELLALIDSQALSRALDAGRLEEARQLLPFVSMEERVNVLIQFASRAGAKGDKKAALQMLQEARDLVGEQAVNAAELGALLQIAWACATIEPARSFEIIEPVIDQLNVLLAAAAVIDGFGESRYFRDGEIVQGLGQGPLTMLVSQCASDTSILGRGDFERARAAADRLQAREVRLMAWLAIARGVLLENLPARTLPGQWAITTRLLNGQTVSNPLMGH